MTPPIVLASSSLQRKKSLKNLNIPFTTYKPLLDEKKKKQELLKSISNNQKYSLSYALCQELAYEKAKSLKFRFPHSIIIGGDQLVNYKNKIFGKPLTQKKAKDQLQFLSNKTHELITSVYILYKNKKLSHTEIAFLRMRNLSKKEIEDYIKIDQPFKSCGSYKLEKSGLLLFHEIKCDDFSSLFGLPVLAVTKFLRQLKAL